MSAASASDIDFAYYEHVSRKTLQKHTLKNFLDLTEHAFAACVHNFTTNTLTPGERKCIEATSKKFIAHSLRVSTVFAEIESQAAEERASKAKSEAR